jgi:hypothetical protein
LCNRTAGIGKPTPTLEKLANNVEVQGRPLSPTQLQDLLQQAEHIQ